MRDVLTDVLGADEGDQDEDEKGCKPDGGTVVENLQPATGISGGRRRLGTDGDEEVDRW